VSSEADLIALVQEAYGEAHRGHQPVQPALDDVMGISHDELHVRMNDRRSSTFWNGTDATPTSSGLAPRDRRSLRLGDSMRAGGRQVRRLVDHACVASR
jgi:hypothetical protein